MRKLLGFLVVLGALLLPSPARGQQGNTTTILFPGAPSGGCAFVQYAINAGTGAFYDCLAGGWNLISAGGGGGTVTHTAGALTLGQLIVGNAGADIAVGNLSGDCTTSGSTAVTCTKINGGTFPTSATLIGTNGSAQPIAASLANTDIWIGSAGNVPVAFPISGDSTLTAGGVMTNTGINSATLPASATLAATNSSKQIVAAALASASIYVGNVSNLPVAVAVSGDATLSNAGLLTVVQVEGAAIPTSALMIGTNSSKQLVATALTSANVFVGNVSNVPVGVAISGDATITNAGVVTVVQVEGAAIPTSATVVGTNGSKQLIAAGLTNTNVWVGNGSNLPVAVAISGDAALANTGALSVTGLHFGATDLQTTSTPPSPGQCIEYNGTGLTGAVCSSGPINSATQYAAAYYSAVGSATTISGLAAPTTDASTPYILTSTPNSSNTATAPTWGPAGVPVDAQTGTSYTIAGAGTKTDRATLVTNNNASAIAVNVPQPNSSGFDLNFPFVQCNVTGAGAVTDTTTASTVNGNATLGLLPQASGNNPECAFWWNDTFSWLAAVILPTDLNGRLQATGFPALSGDVTNSAGSLTTTVSKVNGGAVPASTFALGSNSSSQLIASQPFIANSQTSTYTVVAADFIGCKTILVPSGTFTITLVASGSQPASGQCIQIINYGSGTITVARNGQNINGAAANLTLPSASASSPSGVSIFSDGSNYFAQAYGAASGGSGTVNNCSTTGGIAYYAATGTIVSCNATVVESTGTITLGGGGGTVGNLIFLNATSGSITLAPVTGALGSTTLSLPSGTATIATSVTTPSWLTPAATSLAGVIAITPTSGQSSHQVIGTCGAATSFAPCLLTGGDVGGLISFDKSSTGLINPTADATFTYIAASTTGLTLAGTAPTSAGGNGTAATTLFNVSGVTGGATSSTTANTGGVGSSPTIAGGTGGAATGSGGTTTVGGAGGNVTLTAGNGGNGTAGNDSGGGGGNIVLNLGAGGSKTGTGTAGAPGLAEINGTGAGAYGFAQGADNCVAILAYIGTGACEEAPSSGMTNYRWFIPAVAASGVEINVNASNVITQSYSGDSNHAIDQTAKTAAISTATLCAATAGTACGQTGQYRISYDFWGSGTACSSVTAGSVGLNFTWTDENGTTHTTISAPMYDQKAGSTGILFNFNTTLGTEGAGGSYIISTNGTIIQYATTYTACTTGTGTYNLRLAIEQLQ